MFPGSSIFHLYVWTARLCSFCMDVSIQTSWISVVRRASVVHPVFVLLPSDSSRSSSASCSRTSAGRTDTSTGRSAISSRTEDYTAERRALSSERRRIIRVQLPPNKHSYTVAAWNPSVKGSFSAILTEREKEIPKSRDSIPQRVDLRSRLRIAR